MFARALATFSGIAVTEDMVPTTVYGWIAMHRSEGLQTCTRVDLLLIHQFVTVLATIKGCQISCWGMPLIMSAVANFRFDQR